MTSNRDILGFLVSVGLVFGIFVLLYVALTF